MGIEKRTQKRQLLAYYVDVVDACSKATFGRLVDITPHGFMIFKEDAVEVGKMFFVELRWQAENGNISSLPLEVECRWCHRDVNPSLQVAGFLTVTAASRSALQSLIDTLGVEDDVDNEEPGGPTESMAVSAPPPEFVWSERYTVGNAEIDGQHKRLFMIANSLRVTLDTRLIQLTVADLYRYTREHFAAEERMMTALNYPRSIAHSVLHDQLIDDLVRTSVDVFKRDEGVSVFRAFVYDWLTDHIMMHDKDFFAFAQKSNGGRQ